MSKCMRCWSKDADVEVLHAHASQEPQRFGQFCEPCSKSVIVTLKCEAKTLISVYTKAIS